MMGWVVPSILRMRTSPLAASTASFKSTTWIDWSVKVLKYRADS